MGQAVLVTGGNRGIGFAVAQELVARGARVGILCRDAAKAQAAREQLQRAGGDVVCVNGALDSIANIRAAASEVQRAFPVLDVLIHNAGVWPSRCVQNEDGFEQAFVVNHLAPYLLNHLLEPQLAARSARVVQVSAGLYVKGKVDLERTPSGRDFSSVRTYATTKLCSLLTLGYFAQRWRGLGITINALHPGVIRTGLGDRDDALGIALRFVKKLWKEPREGAQPVVHLALSPQLQGISGRYYDVFHEQALVGPACDAALANAVVQQASCLCGLAPLHSGGDGIGQATARS